MTTKKKKVRPENMKVQGTWISLDDAELLTSEARKQNLRSPTMLASQIIEQWCKKKRLELATKYLKEAEIDGKKVKGKRRPRATQKAAA